MKNFKINISHRAIGEVTISAKTIEEAKKKAFELIEKHGVFKITGLPKKNKLTMLKIKTTIKK